MMIKKKKKKKKKLLNEKKIRLKISLMWFNSSILLCRYRYRLFSSSSSYINYNDILNDYYDNANIYKDELRLNNKKKQQRNNWSKYALKYYNKKEKKPIIKKNRSY